MNLNELYTYEKIIGWGVGKKFLSINFGNIKIDYMVDSDINKQGKIYNGLKVYSPKEILKESMSKVCIVIFSDLYWEDILLQIRNLKINAKVVHLSMISPNPFYNEVQYKRSFALFAEDAIIKGITQRCGVNIEHYIDIGANHPINGNATFTFYLSGATGCLVEPNETHIDEIKNLRPMDKVLNCGIADDASAGSYKDYYMIEDFDCRNTFSHEIAKLYEEKGYKIKSKQVKLMSLNNVCEQYGNKINYINIDVEGFEYEIVKDFDFKKYNVEIFNIEKGNEKVESLLKQHDYEIIAETPSNWIFIKKGLVDANI